MSFNQPQPTAPPRADIPITETWVRTDWSNWTSYQTVTNSVALGNNEDPVNYPFGLNTQQHIDVRTFTEDTWTLGTTGSLTAYNNWPGMQLTVNNGETSTLSNYTTPIDLTEIGMDTSLVLTLPGFPMSVINLASSYVDLSSDGFNTAITSLSLASSSPAIASGNTYASWLLSSIEGVDLTQINGVRLRITATSTTTVTFAGLRVIGPNWIASNVDFDNLNYQLRRCIPLNGDPTYTPPENKVIPTLWRSDLISGSNDPRPINAQIGAVIYTGAQASTNSLTIYLREQTSALITQTDLEGMTQAQLTGQPQPTGGVSQYQPRTVGELATLTMGELSGQTMIELEREPNPTYSRYQAFEVTWGSTGANAHIFSSADPTQGYQYSFSLTARSIYFVLITLDETNARLQILPLVNQALGTAVLDTNVIPDGSIFIREPGRIGFQATLLDGDAAVKDIRPNHLMFAAYQSSAYNSITPVQAAQLSAFATPNYQLFSSWSVLDNGVDATPVLVNDQQRYYAEDSDQTSTQVNIVQATGGPQGVASNFLTTADDPLGGITEWSQVVISFALWFPSNGLIPGEAPLLARLTSPEYATINLTLPPIVPNQWQVITLNPSTTTSQIIPAGMYQFELLYQGSTALQWWVDAVSVFQRAVIWEARSIASDPWGANYAPWTPFRDLINAGDGIMFTSMGTQLQLRGQALRQSATIYPPIHLTPVYAQLGRLVWPD